MSRLAACLLILCCPPLWAQEPAAQQPARQEPANQGAADKGTDKPAEPTKPITADRGPIGKLLEKWQAEGTAAGNTGDFYDNRDREHSELNRQAFPQLEKWKYPEAELQRRMDWALFVGLRPHVTFGNSSTSAGVVQGGSNPRRAYSHPQGLALLYAQYRGNNLYIYPEHRDHDPGHNGVNDGYGDLYPTNTPYLLISQGSSGSDQPFMRAMPYTLAAFRPEVKKKLAETGLLMPTIQMLFRTTSKGLKDPAEYLTGKAHPTVFEGNHVDAQKMVEMAHAITLEDLPPLAVVSVKDEDKPVSGRDFFPPGVNERHSETPCVIARIFRGQQRTRRMVVSAVGSQDVNNRPLKYHWVLLRGDPTRVKITPTADGKEAELEVAWHERRPLEPGSAMESNRIDIGVFVHNGVYYSPPAFITWFCIDHEDRTYDEAGRIVDIGYKTGDADLNVTDWQALFALLDEQKADWPAAFWRKQFAPAELAALRQAAEAFAPLHARWVAAMARQKGGEAALTLARAELRSRDIAAKIAAEKGEPASGEESKAAEATIAVAQSAVKELEFAAKIDAQATQAALEAMQGPLRAKREGLANSAEAAVLAVWERLQADPQFYTQRQAEIDEWLAGGGKPQRGAVDGAKKRLADVGVLQAADGRSELRLARAGDKPLAERLTRFERTMLRKFHAETLAALYPGVVRSDFRVNYVAPEIAQAAPQAPGWRDVYRHDEAGSFAGWTRYENGAVKEFDAEGKERK